MATPRPPTASPTALVGSLARPLLDAYRGLDRLLDGGPAALARIFVGLALGWWLYVPVHELLHAAACAATGGTVTKLEIDALYGGALLAKVVPFVAPASAYAGRLSGFDTGGSDWTYLATDLGPFLLTVWPGVWLLRRAVARRRAFVFGLALPMALAPFISLPGDAYEIGSIVATNLAPWSSAALDNLLRGDDVIKKFGELRALSDPPWGGFALSSLLAIAWAFATTALAGALASRLGEPPIAARRATPTTSPIPGDEVADALEKSR